MPALFTEGVTAGYGRVPIINDISVTAELGSVTTIIGPNGAGKSTSGSSGRSRGRSS
jgi:ABC-type cobalamin/Fe3+-siderophores transport system ATPase subunit